MKQDEIHIKQLEAKDAEYNKLRREIKELRKATKTETKINLGEVMAELRKSANISGYYQGRFENELEWSRNCQTKLEKQRQTCNSKILELEKFIATISTVDNEKHIDFVGSH